MVAVPADAPAVTSPVDAPTVAIAVLLLVHVPVVGVLASVVVCPTHTDAVPVIAVGEASTVTMVLIEQPVVAVYTMLVVPAVSAVNAPDPASIVPTAVVLDDQVPPVLVLL
jgi:hypothetical protein